MKDLVERYATRLTAAGLAERPLVGGLDDRLSWNRDDGAVPVLERVLDGMQASALVCAAPAEPYRTVLAYLAEGCDGAVTPGDCETRTFLHDLPVARTFDAGEILARLRRRKSTIVAEGDRLRVVTFGTVSPEQAFVTFSSVCFAGFVLFFAGHLAAIRAGSVTPAGRAAFERAVGFLAPPRTAPPPLRRGPLTSVDAVHAAMIEAGSHTVACGLVDSYFGNISYRLGDTVHISQTGSSLDDLAGCIDPCPLDGSSCAALTASSELVAHEEIYRRTAHRSILHGHPKFAVILSMDCDVPDCPHRGRCHVACTRPRRAGGVPVVPGEVGTGPTGLCHTLPPAVGDHPGAIVWGHGLFTVGGGDFNAAFGHLLEIENRCRAEYFARVAGEGT